MKRYQKSFKRVMCLGIVLVLIALLLIGCGKEASLTAQVADPFAIIEGKESEGLVYNRESKTIYVMFVEYLFQGYSYGYLSEYIINGHNCEYRDGKIVEVIPNYEIVDNKIIEIEPTYKEVAETQVAKQTVDEKWNALTEDEKEALLEDK